MKNPLVIHHHGESQRTVKSKEKKSKEVMGTKKIDRRLNIPKQAQKVENIWNSWKLARKMMHVHIVPMHSEEDNEGGQEEPKNSSRTAYFSCVLGSQSLKIYHKTPPPYQQALRKGCMKKALTESN